MTTKNNLLPPGLVSNLQQVLSNRKPTQEETDDETTKQKETSTDDDVTSKPIILVISSDGIESPGLSYLVNALVSQDCFSVHVVTPQSDESTSGHAISSKKTVEVASVEVEGAVAYEVSGTTVDCVSLALSGALFSWSKPLLVISGINKGSSCGHQMFYSAVVAGAREAFLNGVPSISISLNWKKDGSQESDFKDAVTVCLPIINAAMRDIEKGVYPKGFSLNLEVPTSPSANKGFKVTKPSHWRSSLSWKAISSTRNQAASRFAGGQPGLGMQFAQLGLDASAAGAARRLATQKKNLEVVESVGVAGKSDFKRTVKYFRMEMLEKEQQEEDDDLDFRALENGFVSVTPFSSSEHLDSETVTAASDWVSSAVQVDQ